MEKQKRPIWKEILPGLLLALLIPLLTWLGYPDIGPHTCGPLIDAMMLMTFAAFVLLVFALVRRRWFRALALLAALCVGIACFDVTDKASICPECDREYYNEIHGIEEP